MTATEPRTIPAYLVAAMRANPADDAPRPTPSAGREVGLDQPKIIRDPVIGHVGEPDENGRALVIFNDEGRRIYGPNVTIVVDGVRPSEPAADEPVTVGGVNG